MKHIYKAVVFSVLICMAGSRALADEAPAAVEPVSAPAPMQETEKSTAEVIEYKIPCLMVRDNEPVGNLNRLPMKFSRTKQNTPLRVMISDDTPSGSGQSLHSSLWLAAVTAAMLRGDTMHGTTITVEFSGNVDGPSAGGVTCLAILSAIDGLPLPDDFAMTGTILPDGTIGVVGGIPEKMRGAAKAGIKRLFVPAFLRICKNYKGEEVDVSRLADELNLKLFRVENIAEAYAILHNKPYQSGKHINIRSMTKLSREVEDVLLPVYRELSQKVSEKMKQYPDLKSYPAVMDGYELSPALARDFYQEGKLLPATLQIFHTWQAWEAWEKSENFLDKFLQENIVDWSKIHYLREYHYRKILLALRKAFDKEGEALFEKRKKRKLSFFQKLFGKEHEKYHGYFPFEKGLGEITAQLEPVSREVEFLARMQVLFNTRMPEKEMNMASEKELDEVSRTEQSLLELLYLATRDNSELDKFLGKLGKALPRLHANSRAEEVERLFYSASCAANSVAGENFQDFMSVKAGSALKEETAVKKEWQDNPFISFAVEMQMQALEDHSLLSPDSTKPLYNRAYHVQASLKSQISALTLSSAVLVIYGADQSNDFIPHLLRNAREAAIQNISDCVSAGIPCLPAICDFETAENDQNGAGVFKSLAAYWRASLYSKALLMSFKQDKSN